MGEHSFSKLAAAGAIFASLVSCASAPPSPLIASISVRAPSASVQLAAAEQLEVTVSGEGGDSVFWKVVEGDRGGSVSASGLYVAPAQAGVFHVIAVSTIDLSMTATTEIEVVGPPALLDGAARRGPQIALTSNWPRAPRL